MSLDESWTFGIFASFDLEVDKVTSKNLTLIQAQTTPDQMQFFMGRIIILSQKIVKRLRAGYGITSESDSAEYSEFSVQHEGPQIAQGEVAEFECDFVGFESGVFFVRASKRDITEGT